LARIAIALAVAAPAVGLALACGHHGSTGSHADAGNGDDAGATGCASGQVTLDDGGCQAAGVPAAMCAQGFASDGNGGCTAILPPQMCPKGQMAVPGDTACHDVAPCASGNWGNIPVDATTQYVDLTYAGGGSDGSQSKPWTKILDALIAAKSGAIVALAAGSYTEAVTFQNKPVRLWGRCPGQVEIVGSAQSTVALQVLPGADGSEVHNLAITGPSIGVFVTGAKGVVLQSLWLHDTMYRPVAVQDMGATSVTVRGSLIEGGHQEGVYAYGSTVTVEGSVIRDMQPASDGSSGRGVEADDDMASRARSSITVRGSLVDGNREMGIYVAGSDADIEATEVRNTQGQASDQSSGFGIEVLADWHTRVGASATLQGLVIENNRTVGLLVASSKATIQAVVVRSTQPRAADKQGGLGISIEDDPRVATASNVSIQSSLVELNLQSGINIAGSQVTVTGTIVRNTGPRATDGAFGDGFTVLLDPRVPSLATTAGVSGAFVQNSARAGISSFGAQVNLDTTSFDCNGIDLDGEMQGSVAYGFDLSGGGDVCGCDGGTGDCQVLSSGLSPPQSVGP
jgi:hypothetical protein